MVDRSAFARDLDLLRAEIDASIGPRDLAELKKMERWGRICSALGYGTAWIAPNLISPALVALGTTVRWAIVMHHVGHRGYDRVPGVPARYTSRGFARGARRYLDWLDWIEPESWRYEHNVLHHGRTGELEDPDLVEENVSWFRTATLPAIVQFLVISFFASTWKLSYYAPNTHQILRWSQRKKRGEAVRPFRVEVDRASAFDLRTANGRSFWRSSILPYFLARFVVLPLLFAPLGWWAVLSVFCNSLLAEMFTNVHSFVLITPNHAGPDLFRFQGHAEDKGTYYYRQVVGTANYSTGTDLLDFLQAGLNYQIEHHLFPDLPLSKYREYQPRVKAICEKHGVPYIQESIFIRLRKFFDIVFGRRSMLVDGRDDPVARDPGDRADRQRPPRDLSLLAE